MPISMGNSLNSQITVSSNGINIGTIQSVNLPNTKINSNITVSDTSVKWKNLTEEIKKAEYLYEFLKYKGIINEEEYNDYVDSLKLMDKLVEESNQKPQNMPQPAQPSQWHATNISAGSISCGSICVSAGATHSNVATKSYTTSCTSNNDVNSDY